MRTIWPLIVLAFAVCLRGQNFGRVTATLTTSAGTANGIKVELVLAAGEKAVAAGRSDTRGILVIQSVPAGSYDLRTADKRILARGIRVSATAETDLGTISIDPGAGGERSSGSAPEEPAEISTVFGAEWVGRLPILGRQETNLVGDVAGAGANALSSTFIHGLRPTYANVTLDGINIVDQFDRGGIDFTADRPRLEQVGDMAVVTSNPDAQYGFGYPLVAMITPSGGNRYHGSLFWQNRNSQFGANDWFNNRDGVARPFLNMNSFGGNLGGPIARDRLLFYVAYEGRRTSQQNRVNRIILTDTARQGIYTYQDASGAVRRVNVLQAAGIQPDPAMQKLLALVPGAQFINNFNAGDSRPGLLRNTAGYSYNLRSISSIDNVSARLDWNKSERHSFSATYYRQRYPSDQPGYSNDFAARAKVALAVDSDLFSLGWRWRPTPAWSLEARGGRNGYSAEYLIPDDFGSSVLLLPLISNPVITSTQGGRSIGRFGDTWNFAGAVSHIHGSHLLQAGFQTQRVRVNTHADLYVTPFYSVGIGTGNPGLSVAALPGISSTDYSAANSLLALEGGYVTSSRQAFDVLNRTSGYVPGAGIHQRYGWSSYAGFLEDRWQASRRLSVSVGLRYEYATPLDERDSKLFFPIIQGNDVLATLRSNLLLDFTGSQAGRFAWSPDGNNFAPQVGLAFRVDGEGRTVFRAGYAINYIDDISGSVVTTIQTNEGLRRLVTASNLSARVSTGLPPIQTPAFQSPISLQANYSMDPFQQVICPDPNLRTPYVQQWRVGIEHRFRWATMEGRYVGNHATGLLRGIDENQIALRENGFLDDFLRAAQNGRLAQAATGSYNPAYNPSIPGSQPLTVFPKLAGGGLLTSSTIQSYLLTGQPAGLAATYQTNRLNGPVNFFPNPYAVQMWLLTNHDHSTYNALQFEVQTRGRNHFLTASYVFSKVLSNAAGNYDTRLEPFLDNNNTSLDRARAIFDQTHAFKAVGFWDLPFGAGHRLSGRSIDGLLGGWSIAGILIVQSGSPFSILSGKSTLSLASGNNSVDTALTGNQLDEIVRFHQTANGPSIIAASSIGPDGRGAAPDGQPAFTGQVFYSPRPDSFGGLQRRMFSGPVRIQPTVALAKTIRRGDRQSIEVRLEAIDVLNRPNWNVFDQYVSSTTFGKITSASDSRILQLSVYYRF